MIRPEQWAENRRSFVRILYGPLRETKKPWQSFPQVIDLPSKTLVAREGLGPTTPKIVTKTIK